MVRNDIDKVLSRTKQFNKAKTGVLIQIKNISEIEPPAKPLNSFKLPYNMEEYLDYRIERFLNYWNKRKSIDDDLLPALTPWYGIAEHTAFVGGKVDFSEETSWHHQVMKTYDDINKISLDANNIYLKLVIDGLKYIKEKAKGEFFTKFRGADGPMDVANVIRGNDMFYDIYEHPDELKNLMEFCSEAVMFTLNKQKEIVDEVGGGVITGFDVWMEKGSVGHISEDASTMISVEQYNEFGRPYTYNVTKNYDHVFMHIHSLGEHNLPSIVSIDNIDVVEISNDPNSKRAIEVYKKYREFLKNKVVCVLLTKKEIMDNIEFLKKNKTIIWYEALSIKEALGVIAISRNIERT